MYGEIGFFKNTKNYSNLLGKRKSFKICLFMPDLLCTFTRVTLVQVAMILTHWYNY